MGRNIGFHIYRFTEDALVPAPWDGFLKVLLVNAFWDGLSVFNCIYLLDFLDLQKTIYADQRTSITKITRFATVI